MCSKSNLQLFNKLLCVAGRGNPILLHWAGKGCRSFKVCLWRIPFCHSPVQPIKIPKFPPVPTETAAECPPPPSTCSRARVSKAGLSHQLSPQGRDRQLLCLPALAAAGRAEGAGSTGFSPTHPGESISKGQKKPQENGATEQAHRCHVLASSPSFQLAVIHSEG